MAEFRMPSLGSDMEKGTLVEWMKKPGDTVQHGDVVAVVETDKGAIEIEAFESGVFERALVELGQTVPVGSPIAIIDGARTASPEPQRPVTAAPPPAPTAVVAPAPPRSAGETRASPAARKLAEERGIDLATIKGSGPEGSIVYVDVENAVAKGPTAIEKREPAKTKPAGPDLAAMQTIIASATARSKREIPHYYLTHEVDITDVLTWLAKTNAKRTPDRRLLPAAMFLKALAAALRNHPEFNGFYEKNTFHPAERIHIGVAIAIRGGGLVAPAIHDTDKLSIDEVMDHLRDLVARVRAGRFRSSEIADPTITLTSLGERGVDSVVPVIYPPQVAIVGTGTPRKRPWVVAGKVKPRDVVTISLAGDHRVGNGHRGALFLAEWANLLQQPELL